MSDKVPDGWTECKLRDIADIKMGQSPKSESYNNSGEGLPFLQGSRTFGSRYPLIDTYCTDPKRIANKGEILFSVRAPVGDINIAYRKICIGRGLASLNAKNQQNLFLFYLLHFIKDDIINLGNGTVFESVNKSDLESVSILLPPLPEQRVIASVLSSIDDKIDLLHRENKTLEAMAETLFKKLFIKEARDYWQKVPLSDVVNITIGKTPPREESHWFSTDPQNIKWTSIKDLGHSDVFVFDTSEYLTLEAVEKFKIPIIPADTVLLSFKLTVGRVRITGEAMASNEAIAHFKFNDKTPFSKEYLYLFLKRLKYESLGNTSSIATAINSSLIKNIEITIPDNITMSIFRKNTEPLFAKIKENEKQIRTLTQLRDTLLPKLMSGELRVDDALCQS